MQTCPVSDRVQCITYSRTRDSLSERRPLPRTLLWRAKLQLPPLYTSGCISNGIIIFLHGLCLTTIDLYCHLLDLKIYGFVGCGLPPRPNAVAHNANEIERKRVDPLQKFTGSPLATPMPTVPKVFVQSCLKQNKPHQKHNLLG